MTIRTLLALAIVSIFATAQPGMAADAVPVVERLAEPGYVAIPIDVARNGTLSVKGRIHGLDLVLMIDFGNEGALFDIRALRKQGVEFEKTEIRVPSPRKVVQIQTADVMGIEFGGVSTGRTTIYAGDVDALYGIAPNADGPDGVLGRGFLSEHKAFIDFEKMQLHLKPR